jgi:hypothetical protein
VPDGTLEPEGTTFTVDAIDPPPPNGRFVKPEPSPVNAPEKVDVVNVFVEASKEIFCSGQYSDAEKTLLADKMIKPIINQIVPNTFVKNAIEKVIDTLKTPESANKLLIQHPNIKDTLKHILQGKFIVPTTIKQVLPFLNSDVFVIGAALGYQLVIGNNVNDDLNITKQFKEDLADARANIPANGKIDLG